MAALAGYALGSLFDGGDSDSTENYSSYQRTTRGTGSTRQSGRVNTGQRNSFLFSLLVLASYIIRADGKVMHSEMEAVRRFLRVNFGDVAVSEGEQILRRLFDEQKRMESQRVGAYRDIVMQSCGQIADNLSYGQRLQLLAFLADLIRADGVIDPQEVQALRDVCRALRMNDSEVDSLLNLHDSSTSLEAAYKVLGLDPSATDDEVRKAYRALALKHHPDRVATLGEDVRKAAEKKFQEINAAKDLIYKARGL